MTSGNLAAWVQAVGSILAICAGFGTVWWQSQEAERARERDRASRAEVIAFRLSGWLSEVGSRVKLKSELYDHLRIHNPTMPQLYPNIAAQLKLNIVVGIESVMSDLHYLNAGAGDVAQLAYFVRYFDAFLDMANDRRELSKERLANAYDNIEQQLKNMQQLHINAERRLSPIIDAGVKHER